MIIKGKARGNGAQLGRYLVTQGKNERIRVIEVRGVSAEDVPGAVREMDVLALGARTEKGLYHAQINTRAEERLTDEQRTYAVDRLEAALGFAGQSRVVVVHEKNGREHCHVVWSRIDLDRMAAIPDSHNYRKHEEVARHLEREFGHERVQGAHAERDGKERPERTPSHREMLQADRTGLSPGEVKAQITELWRNTDSGQAFANALEDQGWMLARGDRRDFVVIDPRGGTHSLARRIEGANAADVRARLADLDPKLIPSIAEAKGIREDRAHGVTPERDHRTWEDRLLAAGLAKAEREEKGMLRIPEKLVERDLAWHQQQAARPFTATEKRLMEAFEGSPTPQAFVAKLDKAGFALARATGADLDRFASEHAKQFASAGPGDRVNLPPKLREGQLVVVNRFGGIRRLNEHKIDTERIAVHFTQGAGRAPGSVVEARDRVLSQRPAAKQNQPHQAQRQSRSHVADAPRERAKPMRGTGHVVAKVADSVFSALMGEKPAPKEKESDMAKQAKAAATSSQRRQELMRQLSREVPTETERDAEYEVDKGRERRRGQ